MKLEMDEATGFTIWACVATITCGLCAIGGCRTIETTKWKAIEAGLSQEKSAYQEPIWVKPSE